MKYSAAESLNAPPDIIAIKKAARHYGTIATAKAYANWVEPSHEGDVEVLVQQNIKPVHVWTRMQSGENEGKPFKNSVDLSIACDCCELLYTNEAITAFVLASGDGDFEHLISKIRERGKTAAVIAVKATASARLAIVSDDLVYYDDCVAGLMASSSADKPERESALDLFSEVVSPILGQGIFPNLKMVKDAIKKEKPDFEEEAFGFPSFRHLAYFAEMRGLLKVDATNEPAMVYPLSAQRSKNKSLLFDSNTWARLIKALEPNVPYAISALKKKWELLRPSQMGWDPFLDTLVRSRVIWFTPGRYYDSNQERLIMPNKYFLNMTHPRVQVYRMAAGRS